MAAEQKPARLNHMWTNESIAADKSKALQVGLMQKARSFFLKYNVKKAKEQFPFLLSYGLTMCNSETDKVAKRRTVYGELGGKGQAQGDGSSTRT